MVGYACLDCSSVRDLCASLQYMQVSIIPRALFFALPCAVLAALLKGMEQDGNLPDDLGGVHLFDGGAYGAFSFAMTFLFVFRISQAFSSFCEGTAAGYAVMCHWMDFATAIVACSKYSKKDAKTTLTYQNRMIRLLSFIHAAALASLRGIPGSEFELIDIKALDDSLVDMAMTSHQPVTLISHWIQELVIEGQELEILNCHTSLLNGAMGKFSAGCGRFNQAQRVQRVGFPIHYTQLMALLLLIDWIITPFAMTKWANRQIWCFILTLIHVTFFWCLYFTSVQLDNPFVSKKGDSNMTARVLQDEFNTGLILLVDGHTHRIPTLNSHAMLDAKLLGALHEQSRIPVGDTPDLKYFAGRQQAYAVQEADSEVVQQLKMKQQEKERLAQSGGQKSPKKAHPSTGDVESGMKE